MRTFIVECWDAIMDNQLNPLSKIPDISVRHMIMQILAWMWATTFALWMGSIYAFGISTLAHLFIIAAIVVTVGTFETAKRRPTFFLKSGYHTPSRARNMWFNGKKIKLDENDKGGEHE